jgi:hypothetical protein
MTERYPIGESDGLSVEVRRTADSLSICLVAGSTTLLVPGEYGDDLAARLRQAAYALALDPWSRQLVYADDGVEIVSGPEADVVSSAGRAVLSVPRDELAALAGLLGQAHEAVLALRAAEAFAHMPR